MGARAANDRPLEGTAEDGEERRERKREEDTDRQTERERRGVRLPVLQNYPLCAGSGLP